MMRLICNKTIIFRYAAKVRNKQTNTNKLLFLFQCLISPSIKVEREANNKNILFMCFLIDSIKGSIHCKFELP